MSMTSHPFRRQAGGGRGGTQAIADALAVEGVEPGQHDDACPQHHEAVGPVAKGEIADSYLRWVIYTPYATPESKGLTTKAGSEPWLMYPGTAGAHIMISPPLPKK